jgi:ubiquinone/menaquinone biosynthesis C-methylase UbiE
MEQIRKPFHGIGNIIRFNWGFYLLSLAFILLWFLFNKLLNEPYLILSNILCYLLIATNLLSILVSYYIYDLSDLYKLKWLDRLAIKKNSQIVNINAGFDETSVLLQNNFPNAELTVLDFYDPMKHTEISIKRARKAYPPFQNTRKVNTSKLSVNDDFADYIFLILSAHEIRREDERKVFFSELERILKYKGNVIVIEHLRDMPNFLAYTIGFFHFISRSSWYRVFKNAGLNVSNQFRITPFITIFILEKYGSKS